MKEFERWPTPHFTEGWKSYFKNKPDKPVMHYSVIAGFFGDHMLMYVLPDEKDCSVTNKLRRPPGKFFSMFHFLEYPFSRGFTHIKSADPYDTPDFDAGFVSHLADSVDGRY